MVPAVKHLACESLVELPEADIFHLETVLLEQLRNRIDGPDTHFLGPTACDRHAAVDAEGRQATPGRQRGVHDHAGRCAVRQLAGITRSDPTAFHHRLEGLESFKGVLSPAKTSALYFVADMTGGHMFSETNEEHSKARMIYKKELRKAKAKLKQQAADGAPPRP